MEDYENYFVEVLSDKIKEKRTAWLIKKKFVDFLEENYFSGVSHLSSIFTLYNSNRMEEVIKVCDEFIKKLDDDEELRKLKIREKIKDPFFLVDVMKEASRKFTNFISIKVAVPGILVRGGGSIDKEVVKKVRKKLEESKK